MAILNENEEQNKDKKSGWDLSIIDAILEDPTAPDETDETEEAEGQKCPNCGAAWDPIIGCSRCSLSPDDLS